MPTSAEVPLVVVEIEEQESVDQRAQGRDGVGQGRDGDDEVPLGGLDGQPRRKQVGLDGDAVGPGAGEEEDQLERVDGRPVEHDQAVDGGQPTPRLAHGGDRVAEQGRAVALEERPRRVGAGQDRARLARRWRWPLTPASRRAGSSRTVRASSKGRLAPGGQRLVRADDQHVGTELERMPRQVGVEAEVRRPRRVDDQRDVVVVRRGREAGNVADRADVPRVALRARPVRRERASASATVAGRDAERQPAGRVDLGPYPDGFEARQDQAEQHRAVQRPARDPGRRQRRAPARRPGGRASADREPADVGAPQPRRPDLGVPPARRAGASWCPECSGTSPATTSPTRSWRCLCPGIVNGVGPSSWNRSQASRSGASPRRSRGSVGTVVTRVAVPFRSLRTARRPRVVR